MADDTIDLCVTTGPNLAVQALDHVKSSSPQFPAPAEISKAVLPVRRSGKRRDGLDGVADKTAGCVRVETEEEGDKEVVGVPKRFKRLLTNLVVSGGVNHEHAKQHYVTSDTTSLLVMDVDGETWT